jgi:hypothetical protein
MAHVPYIKGVRDRIFKALRKKEITTSFKPLVTIKQKTRSVKDTLDYHQYKGVYKVECSCGKCYTGEIGRLFHIRIKRHNVGIRNERTRTSALAKHSSETKHHVCLEDTKILARENHYLRRRIREAMEIIKHHNNLNRDGGLEISKNWLPLIHNRRTE